MFCAKCGNEIDDAAVVCPKCGCQTQNWKAPCVNPVEVKQEPISVGLILLSIFLPIVGVILGIVKLCKEQTKSGIVYLLCGIIAWSIGMLLIYA